jgi:hypothetical protein
MRNFDATQNEFATFHQRMNVIANADVNHAGDYRQANCPHQEFCVTATAAAASRDPAAT